MEEIKILQTKLIEERKNDELDKIEKEMINLQTKYKNLFQKYQQSIFNVQSLDRKINYYIGNLTLHKVEVNEKFKEEKIIRSYFEDNKEFEIDRDLYSTFIKYLRTYPKYTILAIDKFTEYGYLDEITNMIIFSLFGNLFQEGEERSLLFFIKVKQTFK
jgi:hypothetical protein